MIYMRGQAADYDGWRQLGLAGWGWDDVLPLFLAQEDHIAPPSEHHRSGGEWRVEHPRMRWRVLDAFAEAAAQEGIPTVPDFNGGDNHGAGYFQVNQRAGRRWSAARGFLKPALKRPNLRLETGVHVTRVIIEDGRAVGVEWTRDGQRFSARAAGEVVLAAGAVGTPQLLELSGLGDGERLRALGIAAVRHLPGVGENLQDHLQLRSVMKVRGVRTLNTRAGSLVGKLGIAFEYAWRRGGPMSMAPSQLGVFARSATDVARPDLEYHVQPLSLPKFGDPLHAFDAFTASVCNLRPTSRGSVHIASPDPFAAPCIAPNYLATEEDRRIAVSSLRLTRRIAAAPALARYAPEEILPGPTVQSDEALARAAGDIGTTIFHPVGTCRMGRDGEPGAVVDARLRVQGVAGLRVVDASVMPTITSGNTNSPTLMIAERAALLMREDRAARESAAVAPSPGTRAEERVAMLP